MRSHQQQTSFDTLGTRLGPETSLASPAFLCSAKGGAVSPPRPTQPEHRAQATVNDRASDRDAAPKASLTVVSTVLLKIGSLDARERPQLYEARGEDGSSRGDILYPSGT
jgi:hypothetical protein